MKIAQADRRSAEILANPVCFYNHGRTKARARLTTAAHTRGTAQDKQSPGAGVRLTGVTGTSDSGSELKQIEECRNESFFHQSAFVNTQAPPPQFYKNPVNG